MTLSLQGDDVMVFVSTDALADSRRAGLVPARSCTLQCMASLTRRFQLCTYNGTIFLLDRGTITWSIMPTCQPIVKS